MDKQINPVVSVVCFFGITYAFPPAHNWIPIKREKKCVFFLYSNNKWIENVEIDNNRSIKLHIEKVIHMFGNISFFLSFHIFLLSQPETMKMNRLISKLLFHNQFQFKDFRILQTFLFDRFFVNKKQCDLMIYSFLFLFLDIIKCLTFMYLIDFHRIE